jgi:peroxiredoxin
LVELARWRQRFAALGVAVAAMSYDPVPVLAAFHADHELGYPLLRDEDTRHFTAYGVLNPRYQPDHSAYGIPLPGVLLVSPRGEVLAKFAEPDYRERPDFAAMLEAVTSRLGGP